MSDGDANSDLYRRQNRIDPIPRYGWVWVKLDAIRDLKWPRAADRVDRFRWDAILTRAQRDSIRAFEGTPVAVDGYLKIDDPWETPRGPARETRKSSLSCDLTADDLDWHLSLTGDRDQSRANAIVIKVTPRLRQPGWDLATLREIERRGLMVRVWGWLLLDQEHPEQLSARGNRKVRSTLWEVHPIVEIEVFQDKQTLIPLTVWGR